MKELIKHLQDNLIKFKQISENIVEIDSQTYQLIEEDEEGKLFDEGLEMLCDDTEEDNYIFCFGDKWYWSPRGTETKPQFNPVKYIGKANIEPPYIAWLGVRGKYEILNGSRGYSDWCKKANFLNCETLGICEKNTLAGTLQFQEECKANKIKPVIGATYTVFRENEDFKYDLKFYAKNYDGWQTLLKINKAVLVDNNKFVLEKDLFGTILNNNVFVVVDPKEMNYEKIKKFKNSIDFFQYDSVQFDTPSRDKEYLENLKSFILSPIEPVLIQDSFYLDKDESHIKIKLNQISGNREAKSSNQYFKALDEVFDEFDELYQPDDETFEKQLKIALRNLKTICKECNFEIETGNRHLPKYQMNEVEKKKFKTNRELFDYLIEQGFEEKVPKGKEKEYRERLKKEIEVIEYGDVIDYFLILWDIVKWCKEKDILTGIGRGSAGGTLIAYLLDIIKLDPLEYKLLFERFLTKARVEHGLPDIDTDFEGLRRNEVKRYMEEKYGSSQVCSVGTYTTLKVKAIFKDFGKLDGADIGTISYINKIIEDDGMKPCEIFELASTKPVFKKFIQNHSIVVNDTDIVFKQPKSTSIHACATLVLPKEKTVFEFCPVKKMQLKDGEETLVTEWEGIELEKAGFLKEDILGILQLDKFRSIIEKVKTNRNKIVDIYNLDKNDKKTYSFFKNGWNEDVFQFGTTGLKEYCKSVKPESIEELSAINALYRPGAMNSNAHNDYVDIKFGKKKVNYDYMLEDITKDTLGLYIYQEQSMLVAQKLASFTPEDADILRKVILTKGKKGQFSKKEEYKDKFLSGALNNGCSINVAEEIWNKLEQFASYGFNKSHSVAYAIIGYISQYLKVHYPIEFWTTSFSFLSNNKKDEMIPRYISEIHQTGDIKLSPTDINKSGDGFTPDFENNSIYWSLNSVRMCGDKAVEQLVKDKEEKGEYFDFAEFLQRNVHKGSKVTKSVIENLVMSGAFDEVENINQSKNRYKLIQKYRDEFKIKVDKTKDIFTINESNLKYNWWWNLQQKKLSGFALFDFNLLCEEYLATNNKYFDSVLINEKESDGEYIKTGGYINEIIVRNSQKGEYADVILDNNFEFITIKFWQEQWDKVKELLDQKEKAILLISGKVTFDRYKKKNIVITNNNSELLVIE